MMIPLFYPPKQNVNRMIGALRDTLKGRWWGQGPKVDEFERRFGNYFGFKHCVMTNSGTAALHLAYILAGMKSGDEVIVPVLTCTATCHPLKHMGAKIVFCDIKKNTLTQDYEDMARRVTKSTKALVFVHLGGLVNQSYMIRNLEKQYRISTIEDACQALGSTTLGHARFTCFSFQAIKSMSTGDGGMLICKDEEDYRRAKRLRWFDIDREQKASKNWQAWDRRGITFDQEEPGFKYQPTDIDASIGLAALEDFHENLEHRHALAKIYRRELKDCKKVTLLDPGDDNADWLFMVLVNGNRNAFAEKLLEAGIETNVAHIRNDIFKVFGGQRCNLPNMKTVEKKYLCLPINNRVTAKDVRYMCETIRSL
jgi:perosamine synthetase